MAVLYMDSFDHYTGAVPTVKGWTAGGSGSITASPVRNGVGALSVAPTGSGKQPRALAGNYATLICGFAHRDGSPGGNVSFFAIRDNGSNQIWIRRNVAGVLQVFRGDGTLLGAGTLVLASSQWYYIEVKLTVHNSTGVVQVRVNGTLDVNLSGIDTQQTANAYANEISLEQAENGATFDDLYVLDTSGSAPTNDFLGDIKVEALLPSGNGNSSQFDGSDGNQVDNYLLVDEAAPNGDTDYVESPDPGDKDTYAFGNLVTTAGTVYAVQPVPYLRKTDAGTKSAVSVARLSATEVDSANKIVLDNYSYVPDVREAKPGGGVWTITDVNNAEFGLKVV